MFDDENDGRTSIVGLAISFIGVIMYVASK